SCACLPSFNVPWKSGSSMNLIARFFLFGALLSVVYADDYSLSVSQMTPAIPTSFVSQFAILDSVVVTSTINQSSAQAYVYLNSSLYFTIPNARSVVSMSYGLTDGAPGSWLSWIDFQTAELCFRNFSSDGFIVGAVQRLAIGFNVSAINFGAAAVS